MMLTGRKFWTFAMVLVLCVIVTAGCRRRRSGSTTINNGSDIFRTDNFPGSPADAHYVADDGRAMSPASTTFNDDLEVTFNGNRGQAMITYTVNASSDVFYGQYYDGSTFTPPVRLGAIDYTGGGSVDTGNVIHAFLNTSSHASDDAQQRDGDCLLIWRSNDYDDGSAGDDTNDCLFVTYFDSSSAANASARFGFQEFATRISADDLGGEDVRSFGVATDGLCGEARWNTSDNSYSYGQDTTSIVVVWVQREDNNGVAGYEDTALHAVRFDPAEILAADLPLTPSADTRLGMVAFGASDSGTSSEETQVDESFFATYNNAVIYRAGADNSTVGDDAPAFTGYGGLMGDGDDITLQVITFNLATGGINPPQHLNAGAPSATDFVENHAFFLTQDGDNLARRSIYGSDEGLSCLVVYFVELIGDLDGEGDFGDLINNDTLAMYELDEAAGTLLEDALLDIEDADINDGVDPDEADTVMSRNGDYIWAVWLEVLDSGLSDETALWARQYQTTRIADDGTFPVPDLLANTTSATFQCNLDVDAEPVAWFQIQNHVEYTCGAQSDPDVVHVFFEQSGGADDEIDYVRFVADVDTSPAGCVPTVTLFAFEIFEEGDQPGSGSINDENYGFASTDGGDTGNYYTAYIDDIDGTLTTDYRLFGEKNGVGGGNVEIDSGVSYRQTWYTELGLVATPHGSEIGQYDSVDDSDSDARPHANQIVHVFFWEDQYTENDGSDEGAIRTRAFFTTDPATSFGDNFSPNAGTTFAEPFGMEAPFESSYSYDDSYDFRGVAVRENTVGVWFTQSDHVYYQEFNGGDPSSIGWNTEGDNNDIENPFLVDDNTDTDFEDFELFVAPSCDCDNLDFAMVFWETYTDDDHDNERLRVRVLDGGN